MGYFIGLHTSSVFFMNVFSNLSELTLIGNLLCTKYCTEHSSIFLILPTATRYRH